MIVYRLSHAKYASALSSSGAANRWNRAFQFVIYCSENISLCALELLAHTNGIRPAGEFKIMEIEILNPAGVKSIDAKALPESWHQLHSYSQTQAIGSDWYESKSSLCLKIPSAIIQSEFNYMINTHHPHFLKKVKLKETRNFFWDNRFPSN
jgi:RES domain-containing protein